MHPPPSFMRSIHRRQMHFRSNLQEHKPLDDLRPSTYISKRNCSKLIAAVKFSIRLVNSHNSFEGLLVRPLWPMWPYRNSAIFLVKKLNSPSGFSWNQRLHFPVFEGVRSPRQEFFCIRPCPSTQWKIMVSLMGLQGGVPKRLAQKVLFYGNVKMSTLGWAEPLILLSRWQPYLWWKF